MSLSSAIRPQDIPNLYSWIDNNDLRSLTIGTIFNASSSNLPDKSGNGNNMLPYTAGTGSPSSVTALLPNNNYNCVLQGNMRWDLPFNSVSYSDHVFFFVGSFRNPISSCIFGSNPGGNVYETAFSSVSYRASVRISNASFISTTGLLSLNQLVLITVRFKSTGNTTTVKVRFNGKEVSTTTANTIQNITNIYINWRGFSTNDGISDFGESLLYTRALSSAEVGLVERGLMFKWKINPYSI